MSNAVELNATEQADAAEQLKVLMSERGFLEPDRGDLDDPGITWRHQRPDYSLANLSYMMGKTKNHAHGSLELIVENLVKTWEMEASHKVNFKEWTTVNHDQYRVSANGGTVFYGIDAVNAGNYNVLLNGCPKELYDAEKETFDSSHALFRGAFTGGFPWEVLEVFSGPPKVVFIWRHWAKFTGEYKGNVGSGETVEMTGFAVVLVEDMKICSIEIYYNPVVFLEAMEGKRDVSTLGEFGAAHDCPLMKHRG